MVLGDSFLFTYKIYFMYMSIFAFMCIYVCTIWVPCACGGQKEGVGSLRIVVKK